MEGSPVEEMTTAQYFARHALFALVAFGMLLPAVFGDHRRGWVRRLLGNRALLHFGMVSYGVYLWHLAWIIQLVHWDLGEHEVIGPWFTWLPIVDRRRVDPRQPLLLHRRTAGPFAEAARP